MSRLVKVKDSQAALLLTRLEALALRRFCGSSNRGEFRDNREHGAFHRAVEKLYKVSAIWGDGSSTGV